MPSSPGDFQPSVTASLVQATEKRQSYIRAEQAQLNQIDADLAAAGSRLMNAGLVEIICGTTEAPLWVCSGWVANIRNRVMASQPPPGERSTRWVCLRELGSSARLSYGDAVYLWNVEANASMVCTYPGWSIEAKPDQVGSDATYSGWLQFRLVHPSEPGRIAPISDGAPVALEAMRDVSDPVRFLRPFIQDGACFLERRIWDTEYPQLHRFYLKSVPVVAAAAADQPAPLTSSSTIRLRSQTTGQLVWASATNISWIYNRVMVDPIQEPGLFRDRFQIMSAQHPPNTPLTYGAVVGLHNLALNPFGNVTATSTTMAVCTNRMTDDYANIRASSLDNNHLFRLRSIWQGHDQDPILHGSAVMLESLANLPDGKRLLALHSEGGRCWLERNTYGDTFIIELVNESDTQGIEELLTRRDQVMNELVPNRQSLANTISPNERAAVSLRFDGRRRLSIPKSEALARLTPPSALTVEVRFYLDDDPRRNSCILSKGVNEARDYHIRATEENRVSFSATLLDGSLLELQTPPETIWRQRWHLVSCVLDIPRMQAALYVDGQVQASQPLARQQTIGGRAVSVPLAGLRSCTAAPLLIGRAPDSEGAQLAMGGLVDEVRVFNGARTPAEILDLLYSYAAGNEPGLVGCWRLGERRGDTVPDLTFGGNDAVIGK